jgi:oxygen-dependent protoporphyrinogen oxidase
VLRGLARRGGGGATFASLSGGMETLAQAVAARLPADAQRYGVDVCGISRSGTGWAVETSSGVERADAVVFATPTRVTAQLIARVAARAGALLAEIPHASTVGVALSWPRRAVPHPLAGSGFVVAPGARVRITACTWVSSKWAGRAPADQVLLRAFLGGVHDPEAISLSDDEIVETACHNLGSVLGIASRPTLSRVYRWREASPQLNVGHDERVGAVASELGRLPGLFVTGRGFRAVGIPDCIADARRAAAAAADYVRSHAHAKVDEHVRR